MNEIRVGGSSFVEEVRRLGRRRHQNQSGSDQENVLRASQPEVAEVLAGEAVGVGDVRPGHCPDRGLGLVAPAAAQHQHEVFITQPVTTTDLLYLSSLPDIIHIILFYLMMHSLMNFFFKVLKFLRGFWFTGKLTTC